MNIRQQIVDYLVDAMSEINGIKKVAVWKITEFAPAVYPVLLIRDINDNVEGDGVIGRLDHELVIELRAMFFGATPSEEAREMAARIISKLGESPKFGGVAYDTIINSIDLDIDELGKKVSSSTINLSVLYRSEAWTI